MGKFDKCFNVANTYMYEDLWSVETCDEQSQGPNYTANSKTDYSHNGNILHYSRVHGALYFRCYQIKATQ